MMRAPVKPLDIAAIALALALFIASVAFTIDNGRGEKMVEIQGASHEWVYPLSSRKAIAVPGPLGITHVVIDGGSVYIRDSPCREKIGIAAGHLSTIGSWAACLPNRVFVRVVGQQSTEVDTVAF